MSAAAPAAPPPKSSKKLVVALAVTLILGAGAAGAWYFLGQQRNGDEHAEEAAALRKRDEKPVFSTIEPFTVNLHDDRGERFAQIGVVFEIADGSVDALIKDRLPAVRNNLLLLISSKRIEDLLSPEGKQLLAEEVRTRAGEALGWTAPAPVAASGDDPAEAAPQRRKPSREQPVQENPIRRVLFSQFIVQ